MFSARKLSIVALAAATMAGFAASTLRQMLSASADSTAVVAFMGAFRVVAFMAVAFTVAALGAAPVGVWAHSAWP